MTPRDHDVTQPEMTTKRVLVGGCHESFILSLVIFNAWVASLLQNSAKTFTCGYGKKSIVVGGFKFLGEKCLVASVCLRNPCNFQNHSLFVDY